MMIPDSPEILAQLKFLSDAAIILSTGLTTSYLFYNLEGMLIWAKPFVKSLKGDLTADDRLARGIFLGMFFNTLDNIYWWITWPMLLLEQTLGVIMFSLGTLFNMVFRQGGGIMSMHYHLTAAYKAGKRNENPKLHVAFGIAGMCVSALLAVVYYT